MAVACGEFSCAWTAGPPSPEYPGFPLPAISVRTPVASALNTEFKAAMYVFPAEPKEIPGIVVNGAPTAGWVAGGTPPAIVEITYCCAATRVKLCVADFPDGPVLSTTCTVKFATPGVFGVPLIIPAAGSIAIPAGSAPALIDQTYG